MYLKLIEGNDTRIIPLAKIEKVLIEKNCKDDATFFTIHLVNSYVKMILTKMTNPCDNLEELTDKIIRSIEHSLKTNEPFILVLK